MMIMTENSDDNTLEKKVTAIEDPGEGRKEAEEKLRHLNAVLRAVRRVNQLIAKERDPASLIRGACKSLTETLGYYNAWIALMKPDGTEVEMTAAAGFKKEFAAMEKDLRQAIFPACVRRILPHDTLVVTKDPPADCPDCPLAGNYGGRAGLTRRLSHENRMLGVISVSVPGDFAFDAEEQALFNELADDLAHALGKIEADEQVLLLNRIINTLPQPMSFISDDYRYRAVNDYYAELFKMEKTRIIGRKIDELLGEDIFLSEVKPHLDRCLSGETVGYEVEVDFPGKGMRWMMMQYLPYRTATDRVSGVVSCGIDITDRKKSEQALKESEKIFESTVSLAPVGIAIVDHNGNLTRCNKALAEMIGYSPAELAGVNFAEFTHPGDLEKEQRLIDSLWKEKKSEYHMEKRYIHRDGHPVWVEVAASLFKKEGLEFGFAFVQDITERKRHENALKSSLKEKEILIRELYHRTKNNMMVIMSMLDLQSQNIEDEQVLRIFREMNARIKSMALVHEKLYQSGDLSRIDLREYFTDLVTISAETYKAGDMVALALDMESVFVSIDSAVPCGLIVNELISNSFKHGFRAEQKGEIRIRLRQAKENIEISVQDNGIGLPAEFDLRKTDSFGLKSAAALAEHQLQGSFDIDPDSAGVLFRIRFREHEDKIRV